MSSLMRPIHRAIAAAATLTGKRFGLLVASSLVATSAIVASAATTTRRQRPPCRAARPQLRRRQHSGRSHPAAGTVPAPRRAPRVVRPTPAPTPMSSPSDADRRAARISGADQLAGSERPG